MVLCHRQTLKAMMKKIFILLCLALTGCATVAKENKTLLQTTKKLEVTAKREAISSSKNIYADPKDIDNIIFIFNGAIQNNPNYAGAYYNRAIAYFYKNNYDKSWQDVRRAESLGYKFNTNFLEALKKASGREH